LAIADIHVEAFCRLHGEQDPVPLMLRLCRELLERAPTDQGPTPLLVLGSCQGIRETVTGALSTSSMLIEKDGGFTIVLNKLDPPERQHFSHAHDIVHTFFRDVPGHTFAHDSDDVEELCDLGAAELTMPSVRFLPKLSSVGVTLAGLKACKAEFGTSLQACARRAADLVDEPLCIVVADAITSPETSTSPLLAQLAITKVYRSSNWQPAAEYTAEDLRSSQTIADAFENTAERVGPIGLPPLPDHTIEAIAYDFVMNEIPLRRVIALITPPGSESPNVGKKIALEP
jgi:hypothetical protein